jgi:hypothetical protein
MSASNRPQSPVDAGRQESGKGPECSPVADSARQPNEEAGYGAQTHAAGEDFSHPAPWRKAQDPETRRGPGTGHDESSDDTAPADTPADADPVAARGEAA